MYNLLYIQFSHIVGQELILKESLKLEGSTNCRTFYYYFFKDRRPHTLVSTSSSSSSSSSAMPTLQATQLPSGDAFPRESVFYDLFNRSHEREEAIANAYLVQQALMEQQKKDRKIYKHKMSYILK